MRTLAAGLLFCLTVGGVAAAEPALTEGAKSHVKIG